jgi:class 3 adenylate cyclase
MANSMLKEVKKLRKKLNIQFNLRIGLHTGDIITGIIGENIFKFDMYGSDVEIVNKI